MSRFVTILIRDLQNYCLKCCSFTTLADLLLCLVVWLVGFVDLLSKYWKVLGQRFLYSIHIYLVFVKYSQIKQCTHFLENNHPSYYKSLLALLKWSFRENIIVRIEEPACNPRKLAKKIPFSREL